MIYDALSALAIALSVFVSVVALIALISGIILAVKLLKEED